jgi:hypothetical protein
VILYWSEGSKQKPWRPASPVKFINSDPGLVLLFLEWLQLLDVSEKRLVATVSIHETADVSAAQQYWADLTGIPMDQFRRPTIKRHKPRTNRRNTGADYRGCLIIDVRSGTDLYRHIAGWYGGILEAIGGSANGKPSGFGPENEGSIPSPPASSDPSPPSTLFEAPVPYLAARAS